MGDVTVIKTKSPAETMALGEQIGRAATPGLVLALTGDLGAGKTVLCKGIAAGLGVTETITSPTFTIRQSYEDGRLPFHHMDVYRIEDPDEMEEIGLFDCVDGEGVTVIEWAEMIRDLLPPETVCITLTYDKDAQDARMIEIKGDLSI